MTDTDYRHGPGRVPVAFDVTAPLPEGTTVLEASAGTGKTYAIVGLGARLIAEGVPIDKLLLVTFSRAATAELRERMRERVVELIAALASPEDGPDHADPLVGYLADGEVGEVTLRRERLVRALSDFDASTIATTHTFCNRMLDALGFLGEREMIYEIVEDVDDLVDEAALDLYLRGYAGADRPDFSLGDATDIARDAIRQPATALAPSETDLGDADTPEAMVAHRRVRFAARIREIVEERKRTSRLRTYDDLQMILFRIVTDPVVGAAACTRIRAMFDAVLVDEFQDTDPQQWEIVHRCFHGSRRLVLVGDPKQSIYGFRGAEVLSYLQAVRSADSLRVLDVNRRSDGALVDALARLHGGAELGHGDIVVHEVTAARSGSRLHGVPPVRLRALPRRDFTVLNRSGFPAVGAVRDKVIADVAADIAGLLASKTTIEADGAVRPVEPGDIAILVTLNKTIAPLQQHLQAHGVAAVIGSGTSVFHTAAARQWLAVIRAVEQPARTDLVRTAALGTLIGWDVDALACDDGAGITDLAMSLQSFGHVFAEGGFAAMAQRLMSRMRVAERVLAGPDGERELTDLIQVASLCNVEVMHSGCGLSGLVEWLADRIADTTRWQRHQDQTRRLDRDTQAVQIMTVHRSKGLQFPIVYVPFAWDGARNANRATFTFHDAHAERALDVGGTEAPGHRQRWQRHESEAAGEELRLLYVALTRAQSQVVAWWAPAYHTRNSALHRLLFGRTAGSSVVPESFDVPDDDTCARVLMGYRLDGAISVEVAGRDGDSRIDPPVPAPPPTGLSAARFDRTIDQSWRRTSYSAIVAGAGHGHPAVLESGSESDADLIADEPAEPGEAVQIAGGQPTGTPSLMNGMPFGAAFGTLVHEVLEYVDTAMPDMGAHVADLCGQAIAARMLDVDVERLTAALVGVLTTPLGFGDLWSVGPRDRLAEMEFEFPLADGSATGAAVTTAAIADLMDRHLVADDPLAGYSAQLRALPPQRLRGFLTGSIDSVLRTPAGRFVIVDYKTNRLRPGELSAEDFDRMSMAAEMSAANYPLQALLYSVALHRYLRWRLPGYQAGEHLAPVQYHFVRGMVGPRTPPGCGVFEWAVPPSLVEDLSGLLAKGDR
ncbi:UvrD-helicase domain-containing protein [Gordonia sp. GW1C4-4]|uniref:RecBCD enzyme subunit RecB n=2 Tax=Gordonia tangerina TaxID=2911060 RepID=A0ABS9DK87_9ACTN|nr:MULTISPECIES: UvrD-helicase domain-containing protein [Gordonia]MAU84899.1 exodeoxyribonuclease V subunit beta [Gordonia sp. (in: high G+C Gram-positive bacteria)]MCF3939476.1 UvrD-helicase domain-containing protein [Gordonia tangerina]